ncbi:MAG: hypothetical protein ACTHOE_03745 [Conexibacter sp.]
MGRRQAPPSARARLTRDAAAAAWVCALPLAAIVAAAILLLGPALAGLLPHSVGSTLLPASAAGTYDESNEHARYLIACLAPFALALATWWTTSRDLPISPRAAAGVRVGAQAALAALLLACLVAQYRTVYGTIYTRVEGASIRERYFNPATLTAAAAIATALVVAVRSASMRTRVAGLLRQSPGRRWGALAAAIALTVVWLLHAVNSDASIGSVLWPVRYHLEFTFDEAFAVVNGRTPLVDYSAQYSSLWPFLEAVVLAAFGKSLLVFTIAMCGLTALALLAIFGVLRRATGSSAAALLLYVPFLATSMFAIGEASVNRGSFGNYFGIFPLRYAGPYLVAWLTARHVDRRGGAVSAWLLFTAAGLALINNADFGVAAVAATAAACVWSAPPRDRRALLSLLGSIAAGLASALTLVALLTLARTGELPQLGRVVEYARIYSAAGYAMLPLPGPLGVHTAIYLTYVAAIGVATVRALRGAANRVLTGALAWTGVFGLGAATYYVGRSQPEALRTTFSAWALALALLSWVVLRSLAADPRRRPSIAAVTVLFGLGVATCSVVQMPLPWSQLDRIQTGFVASTSKYRDPLRPPADARMRRFVATLADGPSHFAYRRGAPVALLMTLGHRLADAYGVENVSPYTGVDSIHTTRQVDEVVAALRRAGGNTVVLPATFDQSNDGSEVIETDDGIFARLAQDGFALVTRTGLRPYDAGRGTRDAAGVPWHGGVLVKVVDTRHLHPRALR